MRTPQPAGPALPILAGISFLLAANHAAAQQDLWGRAILSYQLFRQDESLARGFNQKYDLRLDRQVSEPLHFQLFARAEGNNATTEFGELTTKNTYRQLQPGARIDYILPKLQLSGTYDLYGTKSGYGNVEGTRRLQRMTEFLSWSPESFPVLALQGEQQTYSDDLGGRDYREGFLSETLGWTWKSLSLTQLARYTGYDTSALNFSRKTYDLQGIVKYDGNYFAGRFTATADVTFGKTRLDETANAATGVSAPSRILIPVATYAVDDTPLESRDRPLVALPGLIDGNLAQGVGISLGPSGNSYQNIGVDMGRYVALDLFRIHVRDAEGKLVPFGGLVRWDLYTSGDGIAWVPFAGGARTAFLPAQGFYEVSFPSATSRFFKIVSFGTNAADTFVTEIEAYFHTEFAGRETRTTDTRFTTAYLSLAGKPATWLNLTYYANLSDYNYVINDGLTSRNNDLDQIVSAEFIPSKGLDVTVRYQDRRVSASTFRQNFNGVWGIVTATFNPNLVATLEASRTDDQGTFRVTSDTLRLSGFARFLPSLSLTVDVGRAHDRFTGVVGSANRTFLDAVSYAQLSDSVKLTLTANLQRTTSEVSVADLPFPAQTHNERWYGELYWRPNPRLMLSGRLGYSTGSEVSGLIQAYRVEWYPFAGGNVGIGTVLDEDVESNGSFRRFRRIQILPTWMINKHATLSINYNFLSMRDELPGGGPVLESRTRLLYMNLTLTL